MERSIFVLVLVLVLCLQDGLLASALDCAGAGESSRDGKRACSDASASHARPAALPLSAVWAQSAPPLLLSRVQLTQMQRVRRQIDYNNKKRKSTRVGSFSTSNITWNPEWLKASPTSISKKQMDKVSAQPKLVYRPEATAIISHPEHLLPTERRFQPAASKRKQPKRKARVGAFSLLSKKHDVHPQVTRVRRELSNEKRKRDIHLGTLTRLGERGTVKVERPKRHPQPWKRNGKKILFS
ncbi:hypothetical protein GN956_G14603 [Arapaima gigas]